MLPPLLWNLLLITPVVMVLVLPGVAALFSKRASGGNKAWWVAASVLLSWLGYFIYYYFRVRERRPG
ncbi:MAG TPA: hypothetical protein VNR18_12765 [Hyphomicrobiales bacterium]|nr:hypothetical protein [Hyphomicrobiales bacterium]